MKTSIFVLSLILILSVSCKQGNKRSGKESFKKFQVNELWRTDTVILTPESVIYDKSRNVLYVSDMNKEPRMKDGNGFISKLSTDGKILELRWVEGLNSPKGLAVAGDTLYAADVDELVVIDINKREIIKKYPTEGMKMLNDITSGPDGSLYISDTDANKIYKYSNGKVSEWLSEGLNGPNGLLVDGSRLLLASQGSNDLATIDFITKARTVVTEGINHGDGIAFTGITGYYLVSDWEGEIFIINPDFTKVSIINTKQLQSNTADIDFIPELNLLLVPTFDKNCVVAYKLSEK